MNDPRRRAGRKLLRDMTPSERADWYAEQQAELEDFCSYAQAWTRRRTGRGRRTFHDERYEQFLTKASDRSSWSG